MSTVADFLTDAALFVGATQLGEPLTAAESAAMQRAWKRLIDSMGLERGNIHTIRSDSYQLIAGQTDYTLGYDPNVPSISVTGATIETYPIVLTLASPHGLTVGHTNSVVITGGVGSWQAINGAFVATVLSSTTLSIPVDSHNFEVLQGIVSLQIAGIWGTIRPSRIKRMKLDWNTGLLTDIRVTDDEAQADIRWTQISAPPRQAYPDYDSPFTTVRLFPIPDANYKVVVYSEKALENVDSLALTDEIVFAQGYERYYVTKLGIEVGPLLGVDPSATLIELARQAEAAVKSKNRISPLLKGDPALRRRGNSGFSFRSGLDVNRI